ncbi:MAG: hypothetical protein AAB527_03550, partial [Patescibacteria group bacterium]
AIGMDRNTKKHYFSVFTNREMSLGEQREFAQALGERFVKFKVVGDIVASADDKQVEEKIVLRDQISAQDIDYLIAGSSRIDVKELEDYKKRHFDSRGERRSPLSSQSDTIWIAEIGEKIVGYLYFFTDNMEYPADYYLVYFRVEDFIPFSTARKVKKLLKEKFPKKT